MLRSANADGDGNDLIILFFSCTKVSVFVLDIPVERETQINSIVKTLQESFKKLKISLILPQIFENHLRLQQRLSDSQYMYCVELIEEYIKDKVIFLGLQFCN